MTKNGVLQAEYVYNAMGQQVIRRVNGQTIHTIHDVDGNRIAEYDFNPTTQVSTLLREYIWMNGLPVAVVENGQTYYIRTDHIGRPVFATDATGTKVWEVSYLPFGGVHVATSFLTEGFPTTNPDLRFPGQWFQSESGLFQNWMRDYDPTTGRYLQADPLGLVDGASVYGYARQNPGRYVDPRGEYAIGAACIGPQAIYCLAGAAAVGIGIYLYLQQVDDLNFCPLDFFDNPIVESSFPPGCRAGDAGATEWGEKNGIGGRAGRNRFHRGVKGKTAGSRGDDKYGVNPETGDVIDQNGESVGNLNDED